MGQYAHRAFAFGIVDHHRHRAPRPGIIAVGALLEVIAAVAVLSLHRVFFSPFASLAAIAGSFLAAFLYAQSEAGGRKRLLRQILGDRVSERTFKALLDSQQPLALDGERREITVVVCEIFNRHPRTSLPATATSPHELPRSAANFLVENGATSTSATAKRRIVFGAARHSHHATKPAPLRSPSPSGSTK